MELESISLAVKYRPKRLQDLIGQDHIASQIRGMFSSKKMPSAIMLSGSTGLGKTTTARMIARMVNCRDFNVETMEVCGECPSCKMEEHPDVLELNAADARGIDDVRNLIQQSRNMPTIGNKRVFVIDESQQLTSQSQQCLLRPIEEPPKHTLWIICTMSPEKVLPAIAKRCLSLHVKPVEPEVLVKRLYRIAKREGLDFKTVEDGGKVLRTIADLADGGVRNSIQLLESVLYAHRSGEAVDAKTILNKFLSGGEAELDRIACDVLVAVLGGNLKGLLSALAGCENTRGVLNKLRWLLDYLLNNSVGSAKFVPYSGRLFAKASKEAGVKVGLLTLVQLQNVLLDCEFRFNSMSVDERVVFTSMVGNFLANNAKAS